MPSFSWFICILSGNVNGRMNGSGNVRRDVMRKGGNPCGVYASCVNF